MGVHRKTRNLLASALYISNSFASPPTPARPSSKCNLTSQSTFPIEELASVLFALLDRSTSLIVACVCTMESRGFSGLPFGPVAGEENLPRLPHTVSIATIATRSTGCK